MAQQIQYNCMSKTKGCSERSKEFGGETAYQINTGKIVKGHKLTMKDLMQKQKIKSKISSPSNRSKIVSDPQAFAPKMTDFSEKYRGLETLDDEESLYRFIIYQREKQSRESARGIKLFSCQKRGETIQQDSFINNHISFSARSARNTKTSQSSRHNISSLDHNKTVSYDNQDISIEQKITFLSDNLGRRMNEYLNIILQKKEKAEMNIKQDEIKQQAELYKLKNDLINQVRVMNKNIKVKSNNFYRQMKKMMKARLSSAQTATETVKENQLVKSLFKKTTGTPFAKLLNERGFVKSPSSKVRATPQVANTTQSFYSKRSNEDRQANKLEIDNLLSIIYKK